MRETQGIFMTMGWWCQETGIGRAARKWGLNG